MRKLLLILIIMIMAALPATAAGLNLRAEEITGDLTGKGFTAVGDVELVIQNRTLTGALLKYDWESRSGQITDFSAEVDGFIITGSEARVVDDVVYITNASITKCTLPQPELELFTKLLKFELSTGRLTTRGTWITVFGYRVIPQPSLSFIIDDSRFSRESREGLPKPIIGVDETRGAYLGVTYQTVPSRDYLFRSTAIYGAQTGLEGDFEYLRRLGESGTFSIQWLETPKNPYPFGGVRFDYDLPGGALSIVAVQAQEENDQILRYLPELRYTGATRRIGEFQLTPGLRWGYLESPESGLAASRLVGEVQAGWRHLLSAGYYLDGSTEGKVAFYGTGAADEPYWEASSSVQLRKRLANWTLGLGYELTEVAGKPYFQEYLLPTTGRYALVSGNYARTFGGGRLSGGSTVKYDLVARQFSSASYTLSLSGRTDLLALSTSVALNHDLVQSRLKTASFSGELGLADKWILGANVNYNFDKAAWEKSAVSLLRKLHCYDIKLEYNLKEEELGAKIEFTW